MRNNEWANLFKLRCSHCGSSHLTEKIFKKLKEGKCYKKPPFNPNYSDNNLNEHNVQTPNECFRYGLEDHLIADCQKPETSDKRGNWNTQDPKPFV